VAMFAPEISPSGGLRLAASAPGAASSFPGAANVLSPGEVPPLPEPYPPQTAVPVLQGSVATTCKPATVTAQAF